MQKRRLADRLTSSIGLGGAKLSLRKERPSREQSIRTIHTALDVGITLLDTSDVYALDRAEMGHNERLMADALRCWDGDQEAVLIATKGGQYWHDGVPLFDGSRAAIRAACEASLVALGVERIGLYLLHRLPKDYDPRGSQWGDTFLESVETLRDLRSEGKIARAGLSNVDADMIEAALAVTRIDAVQNPIGVLAPPDPAQLAVCDREQLPLLGWGPLKGTLMPDAGADPAVAGRVAALQAIANERGVSLQRVTLAWELASSPWIIPIIGARRPESVRDSAAAVELALTAAEVASVESASDLEKANGRNGAADA